VTPPGFAGKLPVMKCGLLHGLRAFIVAGACALALAQDTPVNTSPTPSAPATNEVAILKTSVGEMVLEFWPDVAPKTVENFKKLARQGFYDGTCFHRIIKGFMIQGGDPKTKDPAREAEWGTGDPGYKIKAEFNDRKHVRGVISMARAAHPDSAGCQFFICLDPAPFLDGKYTAFGKLIKGEDVLVKIGDTPVGPSPSGERSKPLQRVTLESVKIVPAASVK
jgi:peptidyl-prolyl cis-trans isomerase B (cyclophilin B)